MLQAMGTTPSPTSSLNACHQTPPANASHKIIHPVVAEPGTLQADADVILGDYQPDKVLDPTPQHKTTIAEDITNLAQIREKAAKWGDAALMQMVICMEAHLMDHSLAEENKKKQSCIKDFFTIYKNI